MVEFFLDFVDAFYVVKSLSNVLCIFDFELKVISNLVLYSLHYVAKCPHKQSKAHQLRQGFRYFAQNIVPDHFIFIFLVLTGSPPFSDDLLGDVLYLLQVLSGVFILLLHFLFYFLVVEVSLKLITGFILLVQTFDSQVLLVSVELSKVFVSKPYVFGVSIKLNLPFNESVAHLLWISIHKLGS